MGKPHGARCFETSRGKSSLSQVSSTLQEMLGIRLPRAGVSTVHQVQERRAMRGRVSC